MPELEDLDYFLVLDLEATCIKDMRINPQEIIEFPCLLLNADTHKEEQSFHRFVKPVYRPRLSPFCIKLTGNMISRKLKNLKYMLIKLKH